MKNFNNISYLSVGKKIDLPFNSDDVILFVDNYIYGVFDGVSSNEVIPIYNCSNGGFTARLASQYATQYALNCDKSSFNSISLVNFINTNLYNKFKSLNLNFSSCATTAALVIDCGKCLHFILIGDSGIRINGVETIQHQKLIDDIFVFARIELFKFVSSNNNSLSLREIEILVRNKLFNGIQCDEKILNYIIDVSLKKHNLDKKIAFDIHNLLFFGINGAQKKYANKNHPLGYAVINSFDVVGPDFTMFTRDASDIESLELFTDGYQCPGLEVNIKSWEDMWLKIENEDPFKLNTFPHIKCSLLNERWDDRALLILKK